MPPRPVLAFVIAFILGGVRAESELSWSMLALWIVVGAALGLRLSARQAINTGLIYGSCLGFASTLYGYRGHLLFIERIVEIFLGMVIGALCGALVTFVGSVASHAFFGQEKPSQR